MTAATQDTASDVSSKNHNALLKEMKQKQEVKGKGNHTDRQIQGETEECV